MDLLSAQRVATRRELWKRLSTARDHLEAHLHRDLHVADLAQVACLSEHHFKRLFRQAFGSSPYHYIRQQRLERARVLVRAGHLPLGAIASAVGYVDESSFVRLYRSTFGTTPGATAERCSAAPLPARATPLLVRRVGIARSAHASAPVLMDLGPVSAPPSIHLHTMRLPPFALVLGTGLLWSLRTSARSCSLRRHPPRGRHLPRLRCGQRHLGRTWAGGLAVAWDFSTLIIDTTIHTLQTCVDPATLP
ncbi:MAG: helix-turn-helix transcriptional regulator [Flavobacteriales bacterium]|nr:helix-turn-helix transcriptional regulator [Flavobacteriales bacterium]